MNEIIKKNGVLYGIIGGVISVLILAVIYSTDVMLFVSGWITLLKVLVFTGICILLLVNTKKQLNGFLNFKDCFTTFFIFASISLLITTIFEIILFNIIDTGLKETLKELSIKAIVEFLEKLNTPTAKINEAVKNIQGNDQFSIVELSKGYFSYLVLSSIFGLLLALIFKSKPTQE